jgi:hypothetical protein
MSNHVYLIPKLFDIVFRYQINRCLLHKPYSGTYLQQFLSQEIMRGLLFAEGVLEQRSKLFRF